MIKIIKDIHTNGDGYNEMWFEFSKDYNYRISHKNNTRKELIECAKATYEDYMDNTIEVMTNEDVIEVYGDQLTEYELEILRESE